MLLQGSLARRSGPGPWGLAATTAGVAVCLALGAVPVRAQDTGPPRSPASGAITRLPAGSIWVQEGSRRYVFHDGRFFEWVPQERHFAPVTAPVGVAVPAPPRGSRVTRIRGVTYHVYRAVHYKATRRKGRVVYVVAKI